MTAAELSRHLKLIDHTGSSWASGLEERKRQEIEFHDKHRDRSEVGDEPMYQSDLDNNKFYKYNQSSDAYMLKWLHTHIPGRVFLEYGCGIGGKATFAALNGAKFSIGIDISETSILNARRDARRLGLSEEQVYFIQGDCESTGLPNDSIDTILCGGVLHHMDISYALPELRRILRPGGRLLIAEPLVHNPIVHAYRLLTPQLRTDWEKKHILRVSDIAFAKYFFELKELRYWHIASIFSHYLRGLAPALSRLDEVLTRLPLIQWMAWMFTMDMQKPMVK